MSLTERIQWFELSDVPGFTLPDGLTLTPQAARLRLSWQEDRLHAVRVRLTLSPLEWARVERCGGFGLGAIERGPTFGGALDPGRPVTLEAQLIGVHVAAIAALCEGSAEVAALFDHPALGPLVRDAAGWVTRTVVQSRGALEVGFATRASGLLVGAS